MRLLRLKLLMTGLLVAGIGCDDPPVAPTQAPATSPAPGAAPAAPAAPTGSASAAETKSSHSDADFIEGPETRDPFRSFLNEFVAPTRRTANIQRKVILQRYALDELKLIAIVSGGARPRAMFRDPTGLGVSIKRGDYISKSAGRVKEILADRVIIEIQEQSEDNRSLADRVIEIHAKDGQT